MYKVLIWGSGLIYNENINLIKFYEDAGQFKVIGVTTNDKYFIKLDGYHNYCKNELSNVIFDYVLACVHQFSDVVKEAKALGIEEDHVLSVKILRFPGFNFDRYISLLNQRVSIFANNCWGGVVYNRLGLKFRSPFINMFERDTEYVEFLKEAKNILSCEKLCFFKEDYNYELRINYPVYNLAGMKIHMNHYADRDEAEQKWYERIKRINWDNLFIMMYSDNPICIEKFSALTYPKKVCFSSVSVDVPCVCYLPLKEAAPSSALWYVVNQSGVGRWVFYDIMDMLQYGKIQNSRVEMNY